MSSFDERAAGWDTPDKIERSKKIADAIMSKVPINPSFDVLEFGAGTGLIGLDFIDKVKTVSFIDNSEGMLEVLSAKIDEHQIKNGFVYNVDLQQDVNALDRKFDLIFSSMVLHHIEDELAMIQRFIGMLKPKGYLVVVDLVSEDGSFHGLEFTGHKGFDPEKIREIMETHGLSMVETEEILDIQRESGRKYPLFLAAGRLM